MRTENIEDCAMPDDCHYPFCACTVEMCECGATFIKYCPCYITNEKHNYDPHKPNVPLRSTPDLTSYSSNMSWWEVIFLAAMAGLIIGMFVWLVWQDFQIVNELNKLQSIPLHESFSLPKHARGMWI